ncbi:MAG: NAD(P)H-dependent oxidoreductase [Thioalkalispiraceae bacterium]|jgi:putative NADPH-quinone reductase
MSRKIVIIQGHPDVQKEHYGHALADAYVQGANNAGHEVRTITIAELEFPLIHSYEDFYEQEAPAVIKKCQDDINWADHLVFIYPLWLGTMPAIVKGFIEQLFRPGFAMHISEDSKTWTKLLKGKSARVIITMGMPALAYRWFFRAHSLKSFKRNVLNFCGISPVKDSMIGMVEGSEKHRQHWLAKMKKLGHSGI